MSALEVLTNEGVRALNEAVALGYRLVVEGAYVGMKGDLMAASGEAAGESAEAYAALQAAHNTAWVQHSSMQCVAMLPSTVEGDGLEPRSALDIEFSWLPSGNEPFDAVAVFARLYKPYAKYLVGDYSEGDIVWYQDSSGTVTYYRCIEDVYVSESSPSPSYDPGHWEVVEMTDLVLGSNPPLRASSGSESLVLLHVSTVAQPITVGQGLELNYKLRIFLNGAAFDLTDAETYPVYLESLVPAGDAALQLGFLKEMSQSMATMRGIIADAYGR